MKNPTRLWLLTFGLLSSQFCLGDDTIPQQDPNAYLARGVELKFVKPDSATFLLGQALSMFRDQGDSLSVIESLVNLSDLQAHNGNFGVAYDAYWEALIIADELDHDGARAKVYNGLGWLYILYNREAEVIRYFNQSIRINKQRIRMMNFNSQVLVNDYYALLTFYRKQGNTRLARLYADSCNQIPVIDDEKVNNRAFLQAEMGYILYKEGNYRAALDTLLALDGYFKQNQPSYLVIFHFFLGEVYQALGMLSKSETYYLSAIEAWKQHKSHSDLIYEIYLKYSKLLYKRNRLQAAYRTLEEARELEEKHFGSRAEGNQEFLEIKDNFRIQQEEKERFEKEQRLLRLEQEEKISDLKLTILYVTVAFLVILVFLVYRFFRTKYKAKKKLLYTRRLHEKQKAREVLEVKNKELTASALQVIQKEEALTELKDELNKIKKNPNPESINRLARNINTSMNDSWKEFEARFISVNKRFYHVLNKEFPSLSQGDQKICALIKLNFSSKDMAKLLGISVESVHTTRYRLRKKLGLERSDNLEEFIAKLDG